MMQSQSRHRQAPLRAIGSGALLAIAIGLSGCSWFDDLEPGENFADAYGDLAGFCGFLQDCGGNGNGRMGHPPEDADDSSDRPRRNSNGNVGE